MRKLFLLAVPLVLIFALQGGASPVLPVTALPLITLAVCHPAVPCAAPGCVPVAMSLVPCNPSVKVPRDGYESPGGNCGTKQRCWILRRPCGPPLCLPTVDCL